MLLQGLLVAFAGGRGQLLLDEQDAAERDDLLAKPLDPGDASSSRRDRSTSGCRRPARDSSSARISVLFLSAARWRTCSAVVELLAERVRHRARSRCSTSRWLSAISRWMFSRASRTSARSWIDSRTPSSDSAIRMPAVIVTSWMPKSFHVWIACGGWMSTGVVYASSSTWAARISRRRAKRGYFSRLVLRVAQRARDVLDVDGVAARDRLVAERAERLQVALQRHQIEAPPEFVVGRGRRAVARFQREEVGDQLVELAIGDVDVRVAQQRHQIVGVGPHARVLEVDDVQAPLAEHQVAAVVVAMAQHARLGRQLGRRSSAHSAASAVRSGGVKAEPR